MDERCFFFFFLKKVAIGFWEEFIIIYLLSLYIKKIQKVFFFFL